MVVRLVLVFRSASVRTAMRHSLESFGDVTVVAEECEIIDAARMLTQVSPHVVLLELDLPRRENLTVCRTIRQTSAETAVVMLGKSDSRVCLAEAWAADACGLFSDDAPVSLLLAVVKQAAVGKQLFTSSQLRRIQAWQVTIGQRLNKLTRREHEVLRLVVGGAGNKGIARALCISENTVEKHVVSVLSKFGVGTRAAFFALLLRQHTDII